MVRAVVSVDISNQLKTVKPGGPQQVTDLGGTFVSVVRFHKNDWLISFLHVEILNFQKKRRRHMLNAILIVLAIISGIAGLGWFVEKGLTVFRGMSQRGISSATAVNEIEYSIQSTYDRKKIRETITSTISPSANLILGDAGWCDLYGDSNKKEFWAQYEVNNVGFVDVFTLRHTKPENLYHLLLVEGGIEWIGCVMFGSRNYFGYAVKSGSGGYLSLYLYSYDGIGKLKCAYKAENLFQGWNWKMNGRLFLRGDNGRFEVTRTLGVFRLKRYRARLTYEGGSGSHVLACRSIIGQLSFTYDDKPIQFRMKDGSFETISPIELSLGEQVLVDDNIGSRHLKNVRFLLDDEGLEFADGFFWGVKPKAVGLTSITANWNYARWYHINILVRE